MEGGGGVVISWSEVEFVGNVKKRHHEVRRASERIKKSQELYEVIELNLSVGSTG